MAKHNSDAVAQEEYRVGCWDGEVENGEAVVTHDSMMEELVIDVEELHDCMNLCSLLLMKDQIVQSGDMDGDRLQQMVDEFEQLVRDLEA